RQFFAGQVENLGLQNSQPQRYGMRIRRRMHRDVIECNCRDVAVEEYEVVSRDRHDQGVIGTDPDSVSPGDGSGWLGDCGGARVVERDRRRCRQDSAKQSEKKESAPIYRGEWAK